MFAARSVARVFVSVPSRVRCASLFRDKSERQVEFRFSIVFRPPTRAYRDDVLSVATICGRQGSPDPHESLNSGYIYQLKSLIFFFFVPNVPAVASSSRLGSDRTTVESDSKPLSESSSKVLKYSYNENGFPTDTVSGTLSFQMCIVMM